VHVVAERITLGDDLAVPDHDDSPRRAAVGCAIECRVDEGVEGRALLSRPRCRRVSITHGPGLGIESGHTDVVSDTR
jgi:hypothetical protein